MIVMCFGGSHVCLVSGKPTEGAWVWSAGGSHLGVGWNQEVSVTGINPLTNNYFGKNVSFSDHFFLSCLLNAF